MRPASSDAAFDMSLPSLEQQDDSIFIAKIHFIISTRLNRAACIWAVAPFLYFRGGSLVPQRLDVNFTC